MTPQPYSFERALEGSSGTCSTVSENLLHSFVFLVFGFLTRPIFNFVWRCFVSRVRVTIKNKNIVSTTITTSALMLKLSKSDLQLPLGLYRLYS